MDFGKWDADFYGWDGFLRIGMDDGVVGGLPRIIMNYHEWDFWLEEAVEDLVAEEPAGFG